MSTLTVRPYTHADEAEVLALLQSSLGAGPSGARTATFFRWKHMENPFGRSFILVAEDEGRILGLRAFMRWQLTFGGGTLKAARAVDTATHPDARGRGIFTRLTSDALEQLAVDTDLIFNTPNSQSLPGYLKLGWRIVGDVPIRLRICRPVRFLGGARSARDPSATPDRERPQVSAAPAEDLFVDDELRSFDRSPQSERGGLRTARSPDYLRWRYASRSGLDYRALLDPLGGSTNLAVFRLRPRGGLWEATVPELLGATDDPRSSLRLVREVGRASGADHVAFAAPKELSGAKRAGRFRAPGGMTLVVRPLRDPLPVDPSDLGAWSLSLGDLEAF